MSTLFVSGTVKYEKSIRREISGCNYKIFGGSAWESNPPGTVLAPHTGFEVYASGNAGTV